MNKKTLYGKDAREQILEGVKKISEAVKCTLGPMGRNVLISQSAVIDYGVHSLPLHSTKDGYNTTRAFDLTDEPFQKAGVLLVKEAAQKTVDQAGDGTSTTVVLLEAIATEGVKLIEAGANPMELKKGIDSAVEYVVAELKKMAVPIKGDVEKIRQIATVSANNDSSIGDLIAQAFEKIGEDGIIDIEAGRSTVTEIKIADGYKWNKGWISPLFINNKEKQMCEFTDPLILMYEKRINHHSQVQRALELAIPQGRPILIVCEDADEEGLAFLAMNNMQKRIQCCVVKSPSFANGRREEMEDVAMLTGGIYLSDSKGVSIKEIEFTDFGSAKKVIITKEETVIIGGNQNESDVDTLINELKMNLTQAKDEDEKFPIEKRIARLKGGVAVIQVGGATETEMKEKLDRFDDAVRATKSAMSEGFVPGGGSAFLGIKSGSEVIDAALKSPLENICKNAGVESMVDKVHSGLGYNAKTGKLENLVDSGVIDPVKVLRCALQNAASSAGTLLTTECLIVDTL